METIYMLLLLSSLLSIALYKKPLLAQKVGFGLVCVISLYAAIFFFTHLNETLIWKLPGNFISLPQFKLDPLGMFFSFLISLIAFAVSLFSFDYVKFMRQNQTLPFSLHYSMHSFFRCSLSFPVTACFPLCFYGKS